MRIFSLAFAFSTALLSFQAQAEQKIVLAVADNYAPYLMPDGGILGDIVDAAIARIGDGYDVETVSVPWSRAVAIVEHGQAHGLVGTYHRPDARPWIAPYSEAMLKEYVSVFCRQGVAQADWKYPDDFVGLTFGNNHGFKSPGEQFFEMVATGKIKLQEAQTTEINLKKMSAGRLDCYVNEVVSVEMALNSLGIENVERVTNVSEEDSLIGYLKTWAEQEHSAAFIAAFDEAIRVMRTDGTIEKIISEYTGG